MSIKGKVRVVGIYTGSADSTIIGGVEFVKGRLTDAYVTYQQYSDLVNCSWFEIAKCSGDGSGEPVPGPQGPQGIPGPKGDKGDTGANGAKGDKGEQGVPGAKGDKGEQGIPGPKGDTGANGAKGDKGEQGVPGANGAKGTDGKSVELQMSGTVLQWRQVGGTWQDLIDIATLVPQP